MPHSHKVFRDLYVNIARFVGCVILVIDMSKNALVNCL